MENALPILVADAPDALTELCGVNLVERLRRYWLPPSLTRVMFVSGGSESVEAALRLALQHHVAAGRTAA